MFNFEQTDSKITRYKYERASGVYFLDIIETETDFECWITGEKSGVSSLGFGTPKKQVIYGKPVMITYRDFMEAVVANVDEDIRYYDFDLEIFSNAMDEYYANEDEKRGVLK